MRSLPSLVLFAALAQGAHSQSVLYSFRGDSAGDWFGGAVSGAGDVNGDGFDDLVIGARRDDKTGTDSGTATVFSGADGSVLYTFHGASPGEEFGTSVSGAGDVNGDGFADLIVGAFQDDNNGTLSGSARVFSGQNGSILYTFDGDSALDRFGWSVSGAGDVNGDGFADVIVGAYTDAPNGVNSGSARVLSGVDGSTIYTFHGESPDDFFGRSVSGAGDVNADGFADLIVGAAWNDNNGPDSGNARVFSGIDGMMLFSFDGDAPGDGFGFSVSGAGDVDGDGFDDLIVGAWLDDNEKKDAGTAFVFSGQDGSTLFTLKGDSKHDYFGGSVSGAGDVNGDGFADLIVGAHGDDNNGSRSGSARVFSGADGAALYTFNGDSPADEFGAPVRAAGDVDGDGFADLIVGVLGDDVNGTDSGSARVFSGWSPVGTSYCGPAVPNSTGVPAAILALGSETATKNELWLRATDLPPNKWGYFLASETQGFVANPGGSQGNLCLGGQIARFRKQKMKSGPSGTLAVQVDLTSIPPDPPHTVMAGETWNFQAWFRDENPNPTSNFTDAVSVTFH